MLYGLRKNRIYEKGIEGVSDENIICTPKLNTNGTAKHDTNFFYLGSVGK